MAVFFPENRGDGKNVVAAGLLRKRALTTYEAVASGNYREDAEEIVSLDRELLLLYPPKSFDGPKSAEVKYLRNFEQSLAVVGKWLGYDPAHFTVLRYHQTLDLIRQSVKPNHA